MKATGGNFRSMPQTIRFQSLCDSGDAHTSTWLSLETTATRNGRSANGGRSCTISRSISLICTLSTRVIISVRTFMSQYLTPRLAPAHDGSAASPSSAA